MAVKTYKTDAPRITLAMLRWACKEQRDIFEAEWPEGADATIENVRRAQELGLSLAWGEHWFWPLARKAYDEARDAAWKVYNEAIAPAWAAYLEAIAPARGAYLEAIAPAWKAHRVAIATAWVAAYIQSVAEREAQPSKAS